jgi:hypothetical protein
MLTLSNRRGYPCAADGYSRVSLFDQFGPPLSLNYIRELAAPHPGAVRAGAGAVPR